MTKISFQTVSDSEQHLIKFTTEPSVSILNDIIDSFGAIRNLVIEVQ